MTTTHTRRFSRATRLVAALVATVLAFAPASPLLAATTPLADVPIAAKVTAKPNIVYTVDDSGSMNLTYLPDYVNLNYCRSGTGVSACAVGVSAGAVNNSFSSPPFFAAEFNHLMYNPNVQYQPPLQYDGNPLTFNVGTITDTFGNQNAAGTLKKIQRDPYGTSTAAGTVDDLSVNVTVPLYCNSDWPLDTTIGTNGEYQAGKGADCRINGTKYDAALNGAPAVSDDYNYPWQNTVAPNGAQYFFNQGTTKSLWCNPAAANWPTVTCATYCPAGTPTTTNITPTWTKTGNTTACCTAAGSPAGCASASTYTPASCNTSTLYCSPGLGKSPECVGGCACNTQITGATGTCSYVDPTSGATITTGTKTCTGSGCTATCSPVAVITGCTIGSPSSECAAPTGRCNAYLKGSTTTTLLDDANLVNGGTGTVCRHNNQAYGATPAGPTTYSTTALGGLAPWNTRVNSNASAGDLLKWSYRSAQSCPTMPNTASIPRHYYTISSVQFCNSTIGTNNAQWKGFGTGTCQAKNDLTTYKNIQYGKFTRVDLVNDGRTFAYTDPVTGAAGTRVYLQEAMNYANWYAYYRTRILATKTTSSIAFSFLDDTYRVGFQNLGSETAPNGVGAPIIWVNVDDFTAGTTGHKKDWYSALFNINITNYTTPLLSGMLRVGNLFETGGAGGLPAGVNPLPATDTTGKATADPITVSCQNNYHILFTDGFTNQAASAMPTVAGNKDNVVPAWTGIVDNPPDNVLPNLRPLSGAAWPKPFVETSPAMSDTLADIATYYWARDLRSSMKNNVPANSGKGTGDVDYTKDVAWWQHVNFNAISFGSDGVLDASNQAGTMAAIKAGTQSWTRTTPNPAQPTNPAGNPGASAVDDLWHATVNARGQFVYAKSPVEVSYGLARILAGIQNQRKARIGAAFSGQVLDSTNHIIYEATIEPGWAGDLLKVDIDPATGAEVSTMWQASTQLTTQLTKAVATDEPWFTNRRIVTINSSTNKAVPFLSTKISSAQLASLASDPTQQQKVVAYLRGANTFNAGATVIEGTGIGQFRQRFGPLGDITNAQPVIVNPPDRQYRDSAGDTACAGAPYPNCSQDPGYGAFVSSNKSRSARVYAAANDGMLHSFDASTGNEVFAFIPKALFRFNCGNTVPATPVQADACAASPKTADVTAIQSLTYQDGGVPIYHHHFLVDSSPRVADVDFSNGASKDWHTILVGGLGKGGNSYYALDITDPSAVDENAAAAKVLWEWTDSDLVYTYGRPVIVKTRAYGWVVLVTSGYNNKSGVGKLYFLNPQTGALLKTMSTGSGTPASPSGFAQIHAFVKDEANQVAEQVYGGDLNGDVWRFDVSDVNPANWKVDLFAQLHDPSGNPQPVTTAPQIEVDFNSGVNRYVFIGTGRLLDTTDLTTPFPPQVQTMYAIRDGTLSTYETSGLPIQPRSTLAATNPDGISAIVGGAPNGWYHDLPSTLPDAERIVVDVNADVNIAAYIGTQVQNDPCAISLPATIYARDYATGRSLLEDSSNNIVGSIVVPNGVVGGTLVGRTDSQGNQTLGFLGSTEIPGSQPWNIANPVTGPGNRLSWRLLTGQ